ncbi:MAG: glycosyltransferase [Hahellaceae bacterium]|nr:glycosyltransferase [Hahellaceae bacterium]
MTAIEITAIVPITERVEHVDQLILSYHHALAKLNKPYEFLFLVSPQWNNYKPSLEAIIAQGVPGKIVSFSRSFGEATAIQVGGEMAHGDIILTLTPYEQIAPESIPQLIENLQGETQMVIVNRSPRIDASFNQLQSRWFHGILNMFADPKFNDMGCGIRAFRKEILKEIRLYGDLHRFIPLLAHQQGFKVKEIDIPQSPRDAHRRVYGAKTYLGRIFDLLTIIFLTKFNQKPLRFFGAGGAICLGISLLGLLYIGMERLFFDVAAADRPLLVVFSLLLVLGVQLGAIGLVGETIIFTHAKNSRPYTIRKIVND